jgi:hypothetical protein
VIRGSTTISYKTAELGGSVVGVSAVERESQWMNHRKIQDLLKLQVLTGFLQKRNSSNQR